MYEPRVTLRSTEIPLIRAALQVPTSLKYPYEIPRAFGPQKLGGLSGLRWLIGKNIWGPKRDLSVGSLAATDFWPPIPDGVGAASELWIGILPEYSPSPTPP